VRQAVPRHAGSGACAAAPALSIRFNKQFHSRRHGDSAVVGVGWVSLSADMSMNELSRWAETS